MSAALAIDTNDLPPSAANDNLKGADEKNDNQARFTGHVDDTELGLSYMQARFYDPSIGRFLSIDAMDFMGSGYNPNYFNRYAYTFNDPINKRDPDGNVVETVWDVANVALGVASLGSNIKQGNFGAAALDAGGIIVDGAATLVPFIPGGAGASLKAGRAGLKAADNLGGAAKAAKTCCFVAGTFVETELGLRPIEEIELGDRVLARNPETGETALKSVTDLIRLNERQIWEVSLSGNNGASEFFETTDDHPWWVVNEAGQGSWKDTAELSVGMIVTTADNQTMVITKVLETNRIDATYNLTVADFETYFVGENKVLVHNCKKKAKDRRREQKRKSNEEKFGDPDYEEPASEGFAKAAGKGLSKDKKRKLHDAKRSGEGDRSKRQIKEDRDDIQ